MIQTSTQDVSTLLAALLQGQGATAGLLNGAQPLDIQGDVSQGGFLSALQNSFQDLLGPEFDLSQITDPSLFVAQIQALLTQQKAASGKPLPLLDGQLLPLDEGEGDAAQSVVAGLIQAIEQLPGEDSTSIEAAVKELRALLVPGASTELTGEGEDVSLGIHHPAQLASANDAVKQPSQRPDNALLNTIVAQRQLNDRFMAGAQAVNDMADTVDVGKDLPAQVNLNPQAVEQKPKDSPVADVLKQLYTTQAKDGQEHIDGGQVRELAREQGLGAVEPRNAFAALKMAMVADQSGTVDKPDVSMNLSGMGGQVRSNAAGVATDVRPQMLQSYLSTSVHDPQWQTDFSQRISMMARNGNQTAEIRLNPANLGAIEVRVVMNDDQATITFNAQHAVVRDAIESSLPRLREMFHSSGLQLADAQVMDDGLLGQQRQNPQGQGNGGSQWDRYTGQQISGDDMLVHTADLSHLHSASDLSGIDLFA